VLLLSTALIFFAVMCAAAANHRRMLSPARSEAAQMSNAQFPMFTFLLGPP
jgi:hypothetical protein